jgi:hypothetical protein
LPFRLAGVPCGPSFPRWVGGQSVLTLNAALSLEKSCLSELLRPQGCERRFMQDTVRGQHQSSFGAQGVVGECLMNVPQNDGLRLPIGVGADVDRCIRDRPQLPRIAVRFGPGFCIYH